MSLTRVLGSLAVVAGACCAAVAGGSRPPHANLSAAIKPLYADLMSGGVGDMLIIGDSITIRDDTYTYVLDDLFWAEYGNAGDGYRGLGQGFEDCMREGIEVLGTVNTSQSIISGGRNLTYGPYSIAGTYIRPFPPNGYQRYAVFGPDLRVYYITQPGGGSFDVLLGPTQEWLATVDTDAAWGGGYVDVQLGGDGTTLKEVRLQTAPGSTGPLALSALEMRTGTGGYVQHFGGRGGVGPGDFLLADADTFTGAVGAIDPDVTLIMLDWVGYEQPKGFRASTEQLIDRVLAGAPDTSIVLVSHHPFHDQIVTEADTYLAIARDRGLGFVNFSDLFSGFAEMDALGLLKDDVHMSEIGGLWFASYLFDLFETYGPAGVRADITGEGEFDFSDVVAFLAAFSAQQAAADLAEPEGQWDISDILAFLEAFSLASE